MAAENESARLSDTEGGEKPVREQLMKAHITTDPNAPFTDAASVQESADLHSSNGASAGGRGRLQRKRSHEEVDSSSQDVASEPPRHHARKRSRDSTLEENELNNGQRKVSGERARNEDDATHEDVDSNGVNGAAKPGRATTPDLTSASRTETSVEALSSPKTKRSRLQSATTDAITTLPEDKDGHPTDKHTAMNATAHKEENSDGPALKIPAGSGFGNTSAASPFGALAGSKSPQASQNSASAFAGSGFSAFSTSSSSGFASSGKTIGGFGSGSSFATGTKSPLKENHKSTSPPASSFGGTLGQSSAFAAAPSGGGFGSGASGFGKLGSPTPGGFGSGTGFGSLGGGGLTSFASGKSNTLGKSARPFGAPVDEDDDGEAAEEDDDDKVGAKSPLATEEDKQDERFYEQDLETGEEEETTEFSCRAKLYNFVSVADGKKEWRERGLGVLRFNVRRASLEGAEGKSTGRLLMRADGSHRVVLNTPVTKGIKFGAPSGGPPESGYMYFMGTFADSEKGGLELLQLKMKQANALDLHGLITELQDEL